MALASPTVYARSSTLRHYWLTEVRASGEPVAPQADRLPVHRKGKALAPALSCCCRFRARASQRRGRIAARGRSALATAR